MRKYLFLVFVALATMASKCGDDKEDTTEKICEGEKDIKRYSLKIYIPENTLEEGKPIPTNLKELCLPICENLDGIALNANDSEGSSSPLLIRMDNGYSESIATTDMGKMTDKKKIKPIYNHIRNFLNDDYKVSKKMSGKFEPISESKVDSLLNSFGTNSITFIYSEKTETGIYGTFKIVNSIDSLRYFIGQALSANPNKTVNLLYKVEVPKDEPPIVPPLPREDSSVVPPPDEGKWVIIRKSKCEQGIQLITLKNSKSGLTKVNKQKCKSKDKNYTGKWVVIKKGVCEEGIKIITLQNSKSGAIRTDREKCNDSASSKVKEKFIINHDDIKNE